VKRPQPKEEKKEEKIKRERSLDPRSNLPCLSDGFPSLTGFPSLFSLTGRALDCLLHDFLLPDGHSLFFSPFRTVPVPVFPHVPAVAFPDVLPAAFPLVRVKTRQRQRRRVRHHREHVRKSQVQKSHRLRGRFLLKL